MRAIVGRTEQLHTIAAAIDAVADGDARVLAFPGDPGIGKSALLRAALARSAARGLAVGASGAAQRIRDAAPFGVVSQALEALLTQHDVAHLPAFGDPTVEPFRIHHATRVALQRLAAHQPRALAFDDLHAADRASLDLLSHLLRRGVPAGTLLLLSYRPRQTPEVLLQAVAASAVATTVALGPLDDDAAAAIIGDTAVGDERDVLLRESAGNPFYLTHLARHGSAPGLPAAVGAELAVVSTPARRLLDAAAVIGEPFDVALAARVAGLDDAAAFSALDELDRLALVRPTDVPGAYGLRPPILRRVLYDAAPPASRRVAHGRAATFLAARGAPLTTQAHHVEHSAERGDDHALALLIAAAEATALRAPASTARWLQRALEIMPHNAALAHRVDVTIGWATALGVTGRSQEGRAALGEMMSLVGPDDVALRARVVTALARVDHMVGAHGAACADLEHLLALLGAAPSPTATLARVELAMERWLADDWAGTIEAAAAARVDAAATGDPLAAALATALEATGHACRGELERARQLGDAAAEAVDAMADAELAPRLEVLLVLSDLELRGVDRTVDSARHADRGVTIARATEQEAWAVLLAAHACGPKMVLGHLEEARREADAAVVTARARYPQLLWWAVTQRCSVDVLTGDLPAALRHGHEAVDAARRADAPLGWLAHAVLGVATLEAGDPARARTAILEHAGGVDLTAVNRGSLTRWYRILADADLALGDLDAAERWSQRADVAAAAFPTPGSRADASMARAALAIALGRPGEAAELAEAAAEGFDAASRPIDAARAQVLAARALAACGHRERAADVLRRADARLTSAGARGYAAAARRELVQLGERVAHIGSAPGPTSAVEPLTRREREVADLVARGLTNREIAESLFLGLKTVETHVSRILKKLDVPSRAGVAARMETQRD